MTQKLRKRDLMEMGCGTPGCTSDHSVIYLHTNCHPRRADVQQVHFDKHDGLLHITCAYCDRPVADVAVAE